MFFGIPSVLRFFIPISLSVFKFSQAGFRLTILNFSRLQRRAKRSAITAAAKRGTIQPIERATLRRRPERVVGTPKVFATLRFAFVMPKARFQLNDKPGILSFFDTFYHTPLFRFPAQRIKAPRTQPGIRRTENAE